jgi:hypothetical protein
MIREMGLLACHALSLFWLLAPGSESGPFVHERAMPLDQVRAIIGLLDGATIKSRNVPYCPALALYSLGPSPAVTS